MLGVPELLLHQILKHTEVPHMDSGVGTLVLSPLHLGPSVLTDNAKTLPASTLPGKWGGQKIQEIKRRQKVDFPCGQGLRLLASRVRGVGSNPGRGTKIPHATWQNQKKIFFFF